MLFETSNSLIDELFFKHPTTVMTIRSDPSVWNAEINPFDAPQDGLVCLKSGVVAASEITHD